MPDGSVPDPHAAIIFPSLPAGTLVERNPLPYHEPPYVPKPFLGRSIELQRLVLMLGRSVRAVGLAVLHAPAAHAVLCGTFGSLGLACWGGASLHLAAIHSRDGPPRRPWPSRERLEVRPC